MAEMVLPFMIIIMGIAFIAVRLQVGKLWTMEPLP